MMMRWPGVIKPNTLYHEMFAHEDLLPTFLRWAEALMARGHSNCGAPGPPAASMRFRCDISSHAVTTYELLDTREADAEEAREGVLRAEVALARVENLLPWITRIGGRARSNQGGSVVCP
jgi:hypothetical protein